MLFGRFDVNMLFQRCFSGAVLYGAVLYGADWSVAENGLARPTDVTVAQLPKPAANATECHIRESQHTDTTEL